jgi:hypothetical protein
MRLIAYALASAVCAAMVIPANAQSTSEIERCRKIEDSLQRLNCYDNLFPQVPASDEPYQRMELDDLKVDRNEMRGQTVEVSGHAMVFADTLLLGSAQLDLNPIPVEGDFARSTKANRRQL